MDPDLPLVRGERLGDACSIHVLDVDGPPLVHVTRSNRPEIVFFGTTHDVAHGLRAEAGSSIVVVVEADTATVSRIDLETGRSFSTNLKKFNAPRALARGTLTSTAVQQRTFSKTGLKADPTRLGIEELMAGRTSLTGTTEVRIPEVSTSVSNLSVEQTSRGNVIRWRIKEGIQEIDHIIIFADYNGRLAPLRALQHCGNNNMMYLDNHLSASTNEAAYYVRLVFLDFQQGELVGPAKVEENAS
jgi:hypothetical protein